MRLQHTSSECYCGEKATHWLPRDDDGITARCEEHWTVFEVIAHDFIRLVEAEGGRVWGYGSVGVCCDYDTPRFALVDWVTDGQHRTPVAVLQHRAIAGRWVPE